MLEEKWESLWKDFETARKSEWLKAEQTGKFNAMIKEVPMMKATLKALDASRLDVLNACGAVKGRTIADVPLFLKAHVTKMSFLKKGDLKKLAKASYDEMDKATKPKSYRALKVLMTGIDEIQTLAEYDEKTLIDSAKAAGKEVGSAERVAKVEALALDQIKKAVAKALSLIQKCKVDPTPLTWKALVDGGGTRDLIMALTTLIKVQDKGQHDRIPSGKPLKARADPFNTGQAQANLGPADGVPEVVAKLKAWSTIVKAVADAYKDHW